VSDQAKPGLIYSKMAAIMKALGNIPKDKKITFKKKDGTDGNSVMVRGIETTMNALHDIMAEQGVFIIPEEAAPENREILNGEIITVVHLRFRFIAEDGSEVSGTMRGEGIDKSDKSGSKATSIAFKYFLILTFVATTDSMADADNEDLHRTDESIAPDGTVMWEHEMQSKYENGYCNQCGKNHGKKGDPVVKLPVTGKYAAKECVLLAHKVAKDGAAAQAGGDTSTDTTDDATGQDMAGALASIGSAMSALGIKGRDARKAEFFRRSQIQFKTATAAQIAQVARDIGHEVDKRDARESREEVGAIDDDHS
jgi:hypothetical protein